MMELVTLDPYFQPHQPVENYESLIWTERYAENGDFELKSTDIQTIMDRLPRNTVVSLRESTVPMIVEDYTIEKPSKATANITVHGRSFETVLERRASVQELPPTGVRTPWSIFALRASDAAYLAMRTVLGDIERTSTAFPLYPLAAEDPAVSPLDAIPEIDLPLPADFSRVAQEAAPWGPHIYPQGSFVTHDDQLYQAIFNIPAESETIPPPDIPLLWQYIPKFDIKADELYATVMDLLQTNHHALKAVRPAPGDSQIGLEIYNGANLTADVIFDIRMNDQFDSSKYLLSDRGSKNTGYAYGSLGSQIVLKTLPPETSGLDRRVLLIDEIVDDGDVPSDTRLSRGLVELYKYNATALFDGEITWQIAQGFNRDYFLGDIITLRGEYGLSEVVRVSEFIRTMDANGPKSYPTFEVVE